TLFVRKSCGFIICFVFFFFSSRRRHTRFKCDWSSDVCSSDLPSASVSSIAVSAELFVNSGQLHADGPSGGQIVVQAKSVLNAGPITAEGTRPGGNGGQVQIVFQESYVATTAGEVSVHSAAGPAGHLTIEGR